VTGVRYSVGAVDQLGAPVSWNVPLSKVGETNGLETWQVDIPTNGPTKFLPATLVQVGVTAREVQKLLNTTYSTFTTNLTLWNIQPGLGTVMIEYGRRMAMLKEAADAGAWGMAQYQLTEALEIQETGETTRPAKAALLKGFEQTYLAPLTQDVLAKDSATFTNDFNQALQACNACHQVTGHPYVSVQPPLSSPEPFLKLVAGQPAAPATNTPPAAINPLTDTPLTWAEVWQLAGSGLTNVDTRLGLWGIQPGLGTVMMEYGRRFALLKLAADAGDWGMAQYQLTEALEIQETGETTRPAKAQLLKSFEQTYLDPLAQDILAKDTNNFATHFSQAVDACNACHQATGHSYVTVQPPLVSPEPFLVFAASDPKPPTTNAPPTAITPTFPLGAPTLADAQNLISNRFSTLDLTLALWSIQPGLGTVMQEYGYRFALTWFAAEAGNWDMAAYQLKEAAEIQEVGETTRPAKAQLLKDFETNYLTPINTAIATKDKTAFETAYHAAIPACNACHVATGHPYVRVQISPVTPADFLKLAP
jgi:cytochrome c553